MRYRVLFPTPPLEDKFYKTLTKLPRKTQDEIMVAASSLCDNPYPQGKNIFRKLTPPLKLIHYTAQCRLLMEGVFV